MDSKRLSLSLLQTKTTDEELCTQPVFSYDFKTHTHKIKNQESHKVASRFIGFGKVPGSSAEGLTL